MRVSHAKRPGESGRRNGGRMLPSGIEPRSFLGGPEAISYSELATLSHCEKKWDLVYNAERQESEPSDAMALGSEMHRLLGIWWGHGDPIEIDEVLVPNAEWLINRYDQHYGGPPDLVMEAIEQPFAVEFYGRWVFGWWDGLVRDKNGDLWIAEFKTMGNWSRLNQLPKDKQITLYLWAARRMGLDVKGVMFDAIRTYRWTGKNANDHEPAESFRREWVTRTDEQLDEFERELVSAVMRRKVLGSGFEHPLANVGQSCDWCPVMPECYGISLTLEAEDDVLVF